MKIGHIKLDAPFALAPMAGLTDSAFRRLVKRRGGCGLVVTEMVSSEGLVRGIDRTLEYAEYREEERPVSIQTFGGDPEKMADAAQILESLGADIVDVNMGCPVQKIAKHNAGCSLMRQPQHAARVVRAMTNAVQIPVTVKMRSGWSDEEINAVQVAQMVEDAGAAAVAVHGRTAKQAYKGTSNWDLIGQVASAVRIPVWGSGDCVEPDQLVDRMTQSGAAGVLVGRGALRNPWVFAQALDLANGKPARHIPLHVRGQFLLDYLDLLMTNPSDDDRGVHRLVQPVPRNPSSRERWVVNKLRALASWYTKGLNRGTVLRQAINSATSPEEIRDFISQFFLNAECSASSFSTSVGVSDEL